VTDTGIHLATGTNAAYLHWCATAVLSAIEATPERPLTVHVIVDDDVDVGSRERLTKMAAARDAAVDFVAVDRTRLADLPEAVRHHGGAISCARFLLPEQLGDVDRLVYLDADTLVTDSLAELAGVGLGDHPLGAVVNVIEPRMRWHLERLGLDARPYLNSGVLVLDLDRLRHEGSADRLLSCVRERGEALMWVDQDALNLVHGDEWLAVHPRWNAQNSFWRWPDLAAAALGADLHREAVQRPGVVHFEGPSIAKPWHYLCTHPMRAPYRATAARTPWGRVTLADRTLVTRLIATAPPSWRLPAYVRLVQARQRLRRERSG
jgi:lipopolysaccharide biosynthesis glycosyltransferase